tara:strand:+ start:338 stop:619 length:282 start_codon:yes stop_codon:yes gene_type:complete
MLLEQVIHLLLVHLKEIVVVLVLCQIQMLLLKMVGEEEVQLRLVYNQLLLVQAAHLIQVVLVELVQQVQLMELQQLELEVVVGVVDLDLLQEL